MLKTNISQVAVVALLIVSTFAVAGLTAATVLSDSIAVEQGLGNDPIAGCIKTVGETWVGKTVRDKQNWNESAQNFASLLTNDNTLKLVNQNIAHNNRYSRDMEYAE